MIIPCSFLAKTLIMRYYRAMNETQLLTANEIPRNYPNLHFEPGHHISPDDMDAFYKRYHEFNNGNIESNQWLNGDAVAGRMATYQPRILFIEGLGHTYKFTKPPSEDNERYAPTFPFPQDVFFFLPAKVEKINNEGVLYIVAGEGEPQTTLTNFEMIDPQQAPVKDAISDVQQNDRIAARDRNTLETTAILETIGLIDFALGVDFAQERIRSRPLTRRTFLKIGAGVTGSIAAGSYKYVQHTAPSQAASALTPGEKDYYFKLADLVKPRVVYSDWARYRTALWILKTKDAIDHLGLPKETAAAILGGSGHSFEALSFLNNEDACKQEIKNYTAKLLSMLDEALDRYKPKISREEARKRIIDFLPVTFIQKVTTPNQVGSLEEMKKFVENVAEFKSTRIEEALEPLRNAA